MNNWWIFTIVLNVLGTAWVLLQRHRKLRHIPGPFLASLTDLWAASKIWRGELYHVFIQDLHQQYGPVVRWGPNRVSFAKSSAIPAIYGTKEVYPKAPSYNPLVVLSNGKELFTLITLRNEKRVSDIKKKVSAGFSQSTWLKQESQVNGTLELLLDRLQAKATAKEEIDLNDWLRYWAFDTITQLAFSDDRGFLSHGADVDQTFAGVTARFAHWRTWGSMPSLEVLIYKNPVIQRFQKSTSALARLAVERVQERQGSEKFATGNDLMGRYLAASQDSPHIIEPKDVVALTISTINAGSETTATTASLVFSNLLTHPSVLRRLQEEIFQANVSTPPAFNDVDKLPYLDAVVRETMRVTLQNPHVLERTITPDGTSISDVWIPAGTDVSVSTVCASNDTSVYGDDVESFRPERWLDADEPTWRAMDRADLGFSYGRRVCIGRHLALIEIKKVVTSLIVAFKIESAQPPALDWADGVRKIDLKVRLEARQ